MKRFLDFYIGVPLIWLCHFFVKKNPPRKIERLLVIKLAAFGDAILLQSVLREIHASHPQVKIHWLTSPITNLIARRLPFVERVINWNQSIFSLLPLILQLRQEKYDAVIDYEQWARGTALISFFSGAPVRVGFNTPRQKRSSLFTHETVKEYKHHELEDFYDLTLAILPIKKNLTLFLDNPLEGKAELDLVLARKLLKPAARKRVIIHPGCGKDGLPREWPLANYAVVIHWLVSKLNADVFISGGPDEIEKADKLEKLVGGKAVNLGGELSWLGTFALLAQADLVISGNTGVMHVAAALQRPQIALHGPTSSLLWGPLNAKAMVIQSSCPQCPCLQLGFEYHVRDQSCMNLIEIEAVTKAISIQIC